MKMKFKIFEGITKGDVDVLLMSIYFCILFSSDSAMNNLLKTIISSIANENENFNVDGYNILSIVFISFSISIWFAPSIVTVLDFRPSLILVAVMQTLITASFLLENEAVFYSTAILMGITVGILWTAAIKYLVVNSKPEVVSRNIGVFWIFASLSGLFGNTYAYYHLIGVTYLDRDTRNWIIYGLTALAGISVILFMFLRPVAKRTDNNPGEKEIVENTPLKELTTVWKVFWTKEMLILSIVFCYVGLQQAFAYGIYGPSVGFTLQFGNKAKQLVPAVGILVSIGEVSGGLWQMSQGTRYNKLRWGRRIILLAGVFAQIISFTLVFVNLPASASHGDTDDKAMIDSNIFIALLCSLLLGFGDGCLNTQIYSIMAVIYPKESAHSGALYKCIKGVFVSVAYSLSSVLNLYYLLALFMAFSIIAAIAFICVDKTAVKIQNTKTTVPS